MMMRGAIRASKTRFEFGMWLNTYVPSVLTTGRLPLAAMNVCNADPTQGDLGFAGAKIVTPGNARSSILAIRPGRPAGQGRMPPFEMSAADPEEGAKLIASCIESLTGCN